MRILKYQNEKDSEDCTGYVNHSKAKKPILFQGFWITVPQIGCSFIYSSVFEKCRFVLHDQGYQSVGAVAAFAGALASMGTQSIFVPTDIVAQYMMIYKNTDKLTAGHDKAVIDKVA